MIKNDMRKIGTKIKQRREQLKLSQMDVTQLCGWKFQSRIGSYEAGVKFPTIPSMKELEVALQVPPGWLLSNIDSNAKSVTLSDVHLGTIMLPIFNLKEYVMQSKGYKVSRNNKEFLVLEESLKDCIPVSIDTDSMSDRYGKISFEIGESIVVNPNIDEKINNYVVIQIGEDNAAFGQLTEHLGEKYLSFINKNYPLMKITDQMKIIGVAVKKVTLQDLI